MLHMQWDQLRDLLTLQDRLDGLMGGASAGWTPAVDLYETGDHYALLVELPGLSRDDVQIEARADRLTLKGVRRPAPDAAPRFLQLERGHGPFVRTFAFTEPIDVDRVTADFRDGVLAITVPKREPSGSRRVPVG